MSTRTSLLSDELLHYLIAVGQADVVVGLPTLNNAATVEPVVTAIHDAFSRGLSRARVTLINSDGGSDDGTQEAVQRASGGSADVLLASHTLRTIHRVVTPYHGLPGKRAAVRTIFAAADLLQARAVVVVDPASPEPNGELIARLIRAVLNEGYDFAGLAPRRHPRESPLITQFVRPVARAAFGDSLEDPLGEEYGVSGRFVSHALAQNVWDTEPLRAGFDLWAHMEALTGEFRAVELLTAPRGRAAHVHRPGLRETIQQVSLAFFDILERREATWTATDLPTDGRVSRVGVSDAEPPSPSWDVTHMEAAFRAGADELAGIWGEVLSPTSMDSLRQASQVSATVVPDAAWTRWLLDICASWRARRLPPEHLASAFVPLYLGRVASFLRETDWIDAAAAVHRVSLVSEALAASRAELVARWLDAAMAAGGHRA